MNYLAFLDTKPLYYDKIDLERMPRAWEQLRTHLRLPEIIHIVGTNGKGTTGRFLAQALHSAGYGVGHYISPHISRFNERIWIDGANVEDDALQRAYDRLMWWLEPETAEALSYFEFTTLMAAVLFEECDFAIMEAGLGGEHDATSVFPKRLTLVTPIGFDHQAFLGDTIEAIAGTKLRAMAAETILGLQPYPEVYAIAETIAETKGAKLFRAEMLVGRERKREISNQPYPAYLLENMLLADAALVRLGIDVDVRDFDAPLFGRLTPVAPNVLLDVGHNPMAAEAVARALKGQKRVIVYNSYADKDFPAVLKALAPIAKRVEVIAVDNARAVELSKLRKAIYGAGLFMKVFEGIDPDEEYLVFGSFSVAEAFLKYLGTE